MRQSTRHPSIVSAAILSLVSALLVFGLPGCGTTRETIEPLLFRPITTVRAPGQRTKLIMREYSSCVSLIDWTAGRPQSALFEEVAYEIAAPVRAHRLEFGLLHWDPTKVCTYVSLTYSRIGSQ